MFKELKLTSELGFQKSKNFHIQALKNKFFKFKFTCKWCNNKVILKDNRCKLTGHISHQGHVNSIICQVLRI